MFKSQFAGLDLRQVENIVDQMQQIFAVAPDDHEIIVSVAAIDLGIHQQIGIAQDGGHGRADFVAHVGEELALGLVGHFGLLAAPGQVR